MLAHNLYIAALLILLTASAVHQRKLTRTLKNLRRNCFVTNERGHRVRYDSASDEVRARAEQ